MEIRGQIQLDSPDDVEHIEGALASTRRAGGKDDEEADGAEDGEE